MPLGTPVSSQARTKALFDDEQQFIAPGLQTIALLSELAIERGRGATLTDFDGRTYLDLNAGVSVASLGHCHPRYVAALATQLDAVTVGSFTSRARARLVKLIADRCKGHMALATAFSGSRLATAALVLTGALGTAEPPWLCPLVALAKHSIVLARLTVR